MAYFPGLEAKGSDKGLDIVVGFSGVWLFVVAVFLSLFFCVYMFCHLHLQEQIIHLQLSGKANLGTILGCSSSGSYLPPRPP